MAVLADFGLVNVSRRQLPSAVRVAAAMSGVAGVAIVASWQVWGDRNEFDQEIRSSEILEFAPSRAERVGEWEIIPIGEDGVPGSSCGDWTGTQAMVSFVAETYDDLAESAREFEKFASNAGWVSERGVFIGDVVEPFQGKPAYKDISGVWTKGELWMRLLTFPDLAEQSGRPGEPVMRIAVVGDPRPPSCFTQL